MSNNETKYSILTAAIFSAAELTAFILSRIAASASRGTVLLYISAYVAETVKILMPVTASVAMLTAYCRRGVRSALFRALPLCAGILFYGIPYAALSAASASYGTAEALLYAAIYGAVAFLTVYASSAALFLLSLSVSGAVAKRRGIDGIKSSYDTLMPSFDLAEPLSAGIFASAFAVFLYKLISEIIDTVEFIKEYGETYTVGEIGYMTFRYIFLLAMLLLSSAAAFRFKKLTAGTEHNGSPQK